MEDVEFRFSVGVQEAHGDVVQAVLEEGYGFPAVVEYPDFPDEPVSGDSGQISLEEGYGDDGEEPFNSLDVSQMGVLDVEPAGFHGLEEGLDLPAHPVGLHGFFGAVVGHQDLQLRGSVLILHPRPRQIAHLPVDDADSLESLRLSDSQVLERPRCLEPASRAWLGGPEVLPDVDVVSFEKPLL